MRRPNGDRGNFSGELTRSVPRAAAVVSPVMKSARGRDEKTSREEEVKEEVATLRDDDVAMGRGAHATDHIGNRRLRERIRRGHSTV